jgi:hypothetical protein
MAATDLKQDAAIVSTAAKTAGFMVSLKELLCGGGATSIGIVIGNPLDVVKVRIQTMPESYSSSWGALKDIVRHEGIMGLYKGLSSPICAQFFIGALSFSGKEFALRFLEPNLKKGETASTFNSLVAGSFGGFASCLVLVPSDLVKCKMQVDSAFVGEHVSQKQYKGSIDCAMQVIRSEGIRGMYKGFITTTAREIPGYAAYFYIYDYSLSFLNRLYRQNMGYSDGQKTSVDGIDNGSNETLSPLPILISGGLAGSLSWLVAYPMDVVKTHVQTAGSKEVENPKGLVANPSKVRLQDIVLDIYRRHGVSGFFRGIGVTMTRAFPVNAATFYFYEEFRKMAQL